MSQETILKLGKLWKTQLEADNKKRQDGITIDHPYIKAYEATISKKVEPVVPEKKGKRGK